MLLDVLEKVKTDHVLDLLPFLYNKEFQYPGGGTITLLPNNNIATTWFIHNFKYVASASPQVTTYMRYAIKVNKDFEPDEYFDRYHEEKCYLVHPDKNTTSLDVLKIIIVTEYSLNLNDKLLRKMFHSLITYFNENVFIILIIIETNKR